MSSRVELDKSEECSFLKKRTKKLLPVMGTAEARCLTTPLAATEERFLVLFFKKELLASFAP
ncbi:MAG TPA: hypothetical protein VMB71_08770 [Acetobacteraceae bacterium]|nr:hypothetical protein [Acetobacteraceae bacterium]